MKCHTKTASAFVESTAQSPNSWDFAQRNTTTAQAFLVSCPVRAAPLMDGDSERRTLHRGDAVHIGGPTEDEATEGELRAPRANCDKAPQAGV